MSVSTRSKPAKERSGPAHPTLRVYNTLSQAEGTVRHRAARQSRHLPLRAHGLRQGPHRPHGRPGDLRLHQALPHVLRLRRQLGRQHHRRRRQAHQESQRARHLDARRRRGKHRRLQRQPGRAGRRSDRPLSARDRVHARDHPVRRGAHRTAASPTNPTATCTSTSARMPSTANFPTARSNRCKAKAAPAASASGTWPTSHCGKRPSRASRHGTAPGATAGPAGTSNAPR